MTPKCGRRWLRSLAGVALAVALMWTGALPAAAETAIAIEAGYAGGFVSGRDLPVRVVVQADRLLRGTLEITAARGTPLTTAIEVPGGGEKGFIITVPTPVVPGLNASLTVAVRLFEGGRPLASETTTVRSIEDQELVGLLPGVLKGATAPGLTPLTIDAGVSRFVLLSEADLAAAPSSLGPLSAIGMAADELTRLGAGPLLGIRSWVASGGTLMIDAPPGTPLRGLPVEWQPGSSSRAAADGGRVLLTDGAMAAGRWNGLVEPTGWRVRASNNGPSLNGSLSAALASGSGLQVPTPAWLVAFLAGYVILVGPLGFFVLRRRRRPELAWVAIPMAAILFTGASFVAGRNLRRDGGLVHATVLNTGSVGSVAWTGVGVFSRSGGTKTVRMPANWTTGDTSSVTSGGVQARVKSVIRTAAGSVARLPLNTGEFGLVVGGGPAAVDGRLLVTAESSKDGWATGQVRNTTAFTLDQVAVFAGLGGVLVGRLSPGESRPWTMTDRPNAAFEGSPEYQIWISDNRSTNPVNFALWDTARSLVGGDFRAPGTAVAAGWTRQYQPPIRVGPGRSARPEGRTLVLGQGSIQALPPTLTDLTIRREILRSSVDRMEQRAGPGPTVARFTLPSVAQAATNAGGPPSLILRSPVRALEVLSEGKWLALQCEKCPQDAPNPKAFAAGGPPGAADIVLPKGVGADGQVYVRIAEFYSPDFINTSFTLREARA